MTKLFSTQTSSFSDYHCYSFIYLFLKVNARELTSLFKAGSSLHGQLRGPTVFFLIGEPEHLEKTCTNTPRTWSLHSNITESLAHVHMQNNLLKYDGLGARASFSITHSKITAASRSSNCAFLLSSVSFSFILSSMILFSDSQA